MTEDSIILARAKTAEIFESLLREGWKYFAVSLVALLADYAIFLGAFNLGFVHYVVANILGFLVGGLVAYIGSVMWVFSTRRISHPIVEFGLFLSFGLLGLVIGSVTLAGLVEWAGLAPAIAKIVAAGVSFLVNFAVRKSALF